MKNPRRRVGHAESTFSKRARKRILQGLRIESLEQRQLLAGDVGASSHHNTWYATDVNNDLMITPVDALVVLNALNRSGSMSLSGVSPEPGRFFDVNADNELTPIDALMVINTLNRGEGLDVPPFEFHLGLTDNQGNSLIDPATRQASVSVGQVANLEFQFIDMRSGFNAAQGLFEAYANFVSNDSTWFEPVVNESQVFTFSSNMVNSTTTGTIVLRQADRTASIDATAFRNNPALAIERAVEALGYTAAQVEAQNPRNIVQGTPFDVIVRWVGLDFDDVDIPNISVDLSGVSATSAVSASVEEIPARLADGTFNPDALRAAYESAVDRRSRTANNRALYTGGVPVAEFNDDLDDDVPNGLLGLGNFGPGTPGGLIAELGNDYIPTEPFEAFSIPIRFLKPVTEAELRITLPVRNASGELRLSAYGDLPGEASETFRTRALLASEIVLDEDSRVRVTVTERIVIQPDNVTVAEDGTLTFNPAANDDPLGDGPLTIVGTTAALNGTVSFTADSVTYTPSPNYFGPDSFTYQVQNAVGDQAVGTVSVNVTSVNDRPEADNFSITVEEGTTRQLTAEDFANRISPGPANEGQTATVVSVGTPTRGDASVANGVVTYVAPAPFQGNDQFTYTVSDGQESVTATISVIVTDVNDPPVANDDTLTVTEDNPVTYDADQFRRDVLANDTPGPQNEIDNGQVVNAVPGQLVGSRGGSLVVNANGSATYTPPSNVFGAAAETFVYTITDGGLQDSATITFNITAVNDAPIAQNDSVSVDELTTNNPLNVLDNDSPGPLEEQTQTIESILIVTLPTNGVATVSADGQQILYTPADGFAGTDTLTYSITDSLGLSSAVATVEIEVLPVVRPRARNDRETVAEDSGLSTFNITENDLPNEGANVILETISAIPASQGTLVKVDNSVEFEPAPNFFGNVTFTYTISDDSGLGVTDPAAATGTVTITVTAVNDDPIFEQDPTQAAVEDTVLTIADSTLLQNDSPGPNESTQVLSISAVSAVSTNGGSVVLEGQSIRFTPRLDYNGPDSFTYTISDGAGGTAQGIVNVDIAAVNDPPVLNLPTGLTAAEDVFTEFLSTVVLSNSRPGPETATDEVGQVPLSFVSVGVNGQTERGGTVSLVNGNIRYRSELNYNGSDSFVVTVRDAAGAQSVGTITLTVTPVNDAPIVGDPPLLAFNKSVATYTPAQLLAASTVGPPNESGTLTLVSVAPVTGTANNTVGTISRDPVSGNVVYQPVDGFVGQDRFSITISDGERPSTGIVTIDVREFEPSIVRGSVFLDIIESLENPVRNGQHDPHESGLEMARVRLVSAAADNVTGTDINVPLLTDNRGDFEFTNVPPGTFTLRFDMPIMAVDGTDVAGTKGDSDSILNQFTFVIEQPGGQIAENYNFTLFGFSGRAGNALDLMVSSYLNSNPDLSSQTGGGSMGARAVLDSTGMQQWFMAKRGFENVLYGEINVNASGEVVTLTVVTDSGETLTGIVPAARRIVVKDAVTGQFVVHILGSVDSLNLVPEDSFNNNVGLLRYQHAVDLLLAQDGSVI